MKSIKAQSAMEYLMTYGWAILVVSIILVVLFYSGVFDVSASAPNSCIAEIGYLCSNPILYSSGTLTLEFSQASAEPITISGTGCTTSSNISSISKTTNLTMEPNQQTTLIFRCPISNSSVGTTFTGYLWILYNTQNENGAISKIGKLRVKVISANEVLYAPTAYITDGGIYSVNLNTKAVSNYGSFCGLSGVAAQKSDSAVYVADADGCGFYTLNPQTLAVVNTISIYPIYSVTLSNNGSSAYVTGAGGNFITIDLSTNTITNTITGLCINSPVINLNNTYAYLPCQPNLYKINLTSHTYTTAAQAPNGWSWGGAVFDPTGRYLYIAQNNYGAIYSYDTQTNTLNIISTNTPGAGQISLSINGSYAYVTGNNELYTINLSNGEAINTIGGLCYDAPYINSDGKTAYTACGGILYTINLTTDTITNSLEFSTNPNSRAFVIYTPTHT